MIPGRLVVGLLALVPFAPNPAFTLPHWNPFSKEDPRVKSANEAYGAGHFDDALRGYEDALREHPNAPELQFDRGNALFKLGRQAEAREAYLSALGAKDSALKAQDYYNMGNALWGLDKNDEAAQAFERALLLDPSFEEARHNLEILLAPPPDGGPADGGGQDGGPDGGGHDGGKQTPDGGQSDGGQSDAGDNQQQPKTGDGGQGQDAGQDGGQNTPPPQTQPDAGSGPKAKPEQLDKLQASQLLDALRQREKNLQMWKFRQKQQTKRETEKDW